MGIFSKNKEQRNFDNNSSINYSPILGFIKFGGSGTGYAASKAMKLSAVYRAVELLSSSISAMDLLPFKYINDWKYIDYGEDGSNNIYNLLNVQPNAIMGATTFKKQIIVNMLLTGSATILIDRDKLGIIQAFYLVSSGLVIPRIVKNEVIYSINGKDYDSSQVIYIINNSYDGINGISTISYASETLGLAWDENNHSRNWFKNGGVSGILSPAPTVQINSDKAAKAKAAWQNSMSNDGSNSIIALDSSMIYTPITVSNKDAMIIESKNATVKDIARWFGIPPSKLMLDSKYSNSEQESVEFLSSLIPLMSKIQNEFFRKIYMKYEWNIKDLFFDVEGLYLTDLVAKAQYYTSLSALGVYTPNQLIAKLNLGAAPAKGGNKNFYNVQSLPLEGFGQTNLTPVAPVAEVKPTDNKLKPIDKIIKKITKID